jgi:hypothetical protein
MPQLNVRVALEQLEAVRRVASLHRTSVSELFRAYVEYLMKGGAPIGYPKPETGTDISRDLRRGSSDERDDDSR